MRAEAEGQWCPERQRGRETEGEAEGEAESGREAQGHRESQSATERETASDREAERQRRRVLGGADRGDTRAVGLPRVAQVSQRQRTRSVERTFSPRGRHTKTKTIGSDPRQHPRHCLDLSPMESSSHFIPVQTPASPRDYFFAWGRGAYCEQKSRPLLCPSHEGLPHAMQVVPRAERCSAYKWESWYENHTEAALKHL